MILYKSHHMGKPTICIGKNKGADQLRSNCEADPSLCFRYMYSTIPLLSKSKIPSFKTIFCDCTAPFVSDLVGTQIVGFLTHRLIIHGLQGHFQNVSIRILSSYNDLSLITKLFRPTKGFENHQIPLTPINLPVEK